MRLQVTQFSYSEVEFEISRLNLKLAEIFPYTVFEEELHMFDFFTLISPNFISYANEGHNIN